MQLDTRPRIDHHYIDEISGKYAYKFQLMCDILGGRGKSFLDIAGGLGGAYFALKSNRDRAFSYTMVEFSDVAMDKVGDFGVDCLKHDIDKSPLPIDANSKDVVILCDVLEHMRNPWALLAEATRISNDYVYISGPNFASLLCRRDLLLGRPVYQMVVNSKGSLVDSRGRHVDHIHFITYKNLVYWASKLGLKIVDQRCFIQRRLKFIQKPLDRLVPNLAESYCILFKKSQNFQIMEDPNFTYYDFLQ